MIEIWDCHYCNLESEKNFPNENNLFIFWTDSSKFPNIGKFNKETKTVTSVITWDQMQLNEFIYAYILYTPKITDRVKSIECLGENDRCEFYCNGYCHDRCNEMVKCMNKNEKEIAILSFED